MTIDYSRYTPAKPTTYAGVRFRSRLEARWAVMFDQLGVQWAYEPLDLQGWTPDFILRVEVPDWKTIRRVGSFEQGDAHERLETSGVWAEVFAEVKPVFGDVSLLRLDCFAKAVRRQRDVWVLCLGAEPLGHSIGSLCDRPELAPAGAYWVDVHEAINGVRGANRSSKVWPDLGLLWRQAGADVQWKGAAA
jgi:hypothetical protein